MACSSLHANYEHNSGSFHSLDKLRELCSYNLTAFLKIERFLITYFTKNIINKLKIGEFKHFLISEWKRVEQE